MSLFCPVKNYKCVTVLFLTKSFRIWFANEDRVSSTYLYLVSKIFMQALLHLFALLNMGQSYQFGFLWAKAGRN